MRREGMCFFFFSSRRRHTRCSRDWSSDVCSSDLFWAEVAHRFVLGFEIEYCNGEHLPVGGANQRDEGEQGERQPCSAEDQTAVSSQVFNRPRGPVRAVWPFKKPRFT